MIFIIVYYLNVKIMFIDNEKNLGYLKGILVLKL